MDNKRISMHDGGEKRFKKSTNFAGKEKYQLVRNAVKKETKIARENYYSGICSK